MALVRIPGATSQPTTAGKPQSPCSPTLSLSLGPGGTIRPSLFWGSAAAMMSDVTTKEVSVPGVQSAPHQMYRRPRHLPTPRGPRTGNPLLLAYSMQLWNKERQMTKAMGSVSSRERGGPVLLPAWMEDHLDVLDAVSDRYSYALTVALATEMHASLVHLKVQVRAPCKCAHALYV